LSLLGRSLLVADGVLDGIKDLSRQLYISRLGRSALTPPPVAGADPVLGPDEILWSDSDQPNVVRRD
jgi:hypothetical protein